MSMGVNVRPKGTFDANLEFKDAGLVASSAAAQVDGADKVVTMGYGLFKGMMLIDVSAIEIASNTEAYNICVQLSSSPTFASVIETAAKLELGANEAILGDQDSAVGRYKLYFDNEFNGTYYPYGRIYTHVAGDVATGINYTAFAVPIQ